MGRTAKIERKTRETEISVSLDLDGAGAYRVQTGIPFFDHMLSLMCQHGAIEAVIMGRGDLDVDFHHTVEDVGIALGKALTEALGDKRGIARYGHAVIPMDEALAEVALDFSGRAHLVMKAQLSAKRTGSFDAELAREFFQALAANAGLTLHIHLRYGDNLHHQLEAMFKALGVAVARAVALVPGRGIPSTKGML